MEFKSIKEPTFKNVFEVDLSSTTSTPESVVSGHGLSDTLIFYVNGKEIREEKIEPTMSLLNYLRTKLKLTGSKINCDDGVCGSCTVMLSRWDVKEKKVINYSVNSSLIPVASLHGQAVTTIEGLTSTTTDLHPLQKRLMELNGASCGICIPGVIMSMYTLLCNKQFPTMDDIEDALQGNTCRCGSYCSIIYACKTFAKSEACSTEDPEKSDQPTSKNVTEDVSNIKSDNQDSFENIFPKLLLKQSKKGKFRKLVHFSSDACTWFRPVSLKGLLNLKTKYPNAKLVSGNSKLGAECRLDEEYPIMINVSKVKEMCEIHLENKGITVGASCTLNEIKKYFNDLMQNDPNNFQYQPLEAFNKILSSYGGNQIRNIASLGGNIMASSPISELNALWLANSCLVNVMRCGINQCRSVMMNSKFFTDYKKNCIGENEVVLSIYIPFTKKNQHLRVYKVSRRKTDDVSIVNAAMKVEFHPGSSTVKHYHVAYGGISSTLIMPEVSMNQILGRDWQHTKLVDDMALWLRQEIQLKPDSPGGMPSYRETLAISFFQKFYHDIRYRLHSQEILIDGTPKTELSSFQPLHNKLADFSYSTNWSKITGDENEEIGSSRPFKSGKLHATGKSMFVDDLPTYEDQLYICMVTSTRALAKIVKVDISAASKHPGFVDYINKRDVTGSNFYGVNLEDQVFADEKVVRFGQIIGAVVADSHKHANECARLVTVKYEDISNPVVTIENAIEHESYHKKILLKQGNSISEYESCEVKVESQFRVGPQQHFYPETQNCLVVPTEDQIEIYSSTQSPFQVQLQVSNVLNIPSNKISVKVKRLGGSFGGKNQNSLYAVNPAAVAAKKLRKPIKCRFNRHDDMVITGSQSSFLAKYKIGAKSSGEIVSVILELYSNAGNTIGCSEEIMKRAILSIDNVYKIPNLQVTGYICKTNIASSTMSRGNGIPQALIITEDMIEKLAVNLSVDSKKIRELNMYVDTDKSFCNLPINGVNLLQCWDQCVIKSSYLSRKVEVDDFNRKNVHRKRGISCITNKFGVLCDFETRQAASATVQINKDSSVLLSYSGIELGQGLHTKMQQIISKELGVPFELININQTSTETIPNPCTGFTTVSFDLNGMAVKSACETLAKRLVVYRQDTNLSWQDIIKEAHKDNVNLTVSEASPQFDNNWNWNTETGEITGCPWLYAVGGCSISEVELDCLTGEHVVLRTDVVIDAGKSLNPFIDISQVESAFMEGYGLFCLEEPLYSSSGLLLSTNSATYKIPSFGQCPLQFNVHLLNDSSNPKGIYDCKSIEQSSLALSMSVFFAIKDAIKSHRKKANLSNEFQLNSPVTVERARMSIGDRFTTQFQRHSSKKTSTLPPWNVEI